MVLFLLFIDQVTGNMNKTEVNGYVRAIADDESHPFQTHVEFIVTDFEPNGNRQAIPKSEADNIIRYAINQPIKINFNGEGFSGHKGAFPVGPITSAYVGTDNGRDVIMGRAIIWNNAYKDVDEYLKEVFAEGLGTSWEIYFEESTKDDSGVEWLHGCVFDATAIVQTPAYGPNRTRILAIAEKMRDATESEVIMDKEKESAHSAADIETVRTDLLNTQDLMFKLWEGIDSLFTQTFEIEEASVEKDIGKIASQFAEKLGKIADQIKGLKEKAGLAEQLQSEVATLHEEKKNNERAQLIKDRTQKLSEAGLDTTSDDFKKKIDRYADMDESLFNDYVSDLQTVRKIPAQAEQKKLLIPEPISTNTEDISIKDIARAIKESRG